VETKRIRCIHGDVGGRTAQEAATGQRGVDVVLFGHSHLPQITRRHGTLLFNPGSPTRKRFAPYHSYGILEIGEEIDARIVPVGVHIDRASSG
jgi:putative phosphoesterase